MGKEVVNRIEYKEDLLHTWWGGVAVVVIRESGHCGDVVHNYWLLVGQLLLAACLSSPLPPPSPPSLPSRWQQNPPEKK